MIVFEPERVDCGEMIWYLRSNPLDVLILKNVLRIGIYDGHAIVMKDIKKLAIIAELASQNPFAFNDTLKHVQKQKV